MKNESTGQTQNGFRSRLLAATTSSGKPIDLAPVEKAGCELVHWLLDIAAREVEDFPEEVERVEGARWAFIAAMSGLPVTGFDPDDVLFTAGVLITALDIKFDAALMTALNEALAAMRSEAQPAHASGCPYAPPVRAAAPCADGSLVEKALQRRAAQLRRHRLRRPAARVRAAGK